MTKTFDAAPTVAQGEIVTAPNTGQNEAFGVEIVRRDDQVFFGNRPIPLGRLREVYFKRTNGDTFKVVADVFNEKAGIFTGKVGSSNSVVGTVNESQVSNYIDKLTSWNVLAHSLSPINKK